jgi:hypothetical protein
MSKKISDKILSDSSALRGYTSHAQWSHYTPCEIIPVALPVIIHRVTADLPGLVLKVYPPPCGGLVALISDSATKKRNCRLRREFLGSITELRQRYPFTVDCLNHQTSRALRDN